jgi:hypothetical protein
MAILYRVPKVSEHFRTLLIKKKCLLQGINAGLAGRVELN